MPKGIRRLAVINTVPFLICIFIALSIPKDLQFFTWWIVFCALVWFASGPGLLIKSKYTQPLARGLIYLWLLVSALFVVFQISRIGWNVNPISLVIVLGVMFYLVGVRGYLNENTVRKYYGNKLIEPDEEGIAHG